ncbi:hypothetical protein HC931_12880 [Candidatus Gracilibacteria bacterium]|nr:hypothetical protein [Candidatus Gracilibacteria bacterium]NJQ98593.1 hypothetical protein [Hydrococcus sp. CSU_1_8]
MNEKKFFKKSLFFLFTPIVSCSTVAILPASAANFSTFSQTFLELNNFNKTPLGIGLDVDERVITRAETGIVQTQFSKQAFFANDTSQAVARLSSQTTIFGSASIYQGSEDYSVTTFGAFFVEAGEDIRFDFSASLNLINATDDLQSNSVSSFGDVSWLVLDSENRVLDRFQILSNLNTNTTDRGEWAKPTLRDRDFLKLNTTNNNNIAFTPLKSPTFQFGGEVEFTNAAYVGSYQRYFETDTLISIVAVTKSCNYSSNVVGVCARVSEPSNKFALLFGALCISFFPGVMKQIVQFTREPLIKQLVKNVLGNFGR